MITKIKLNCLDVSTNSPINCHTITWNTLRRIMKTVLPLCHILYTTDTSKDNKGGEHCRVTFLVCQGNFYDSLVSKSRKGVWGGSMSICFHHILEIQLLVVILHQRDYMAWKCCYMINILFSGNIHKVTLKAISRIQSPMHKTFCTRRKVMYHVQCIVNIPLTILTFHCISSHLICYM